MAGEAKGGCVLIKPEGNYYILQGGPENLGYFEHNEDYQDEQWWWSGPKSAKPGDIAFIYLTAPVSRIVGRTEIMGEPFHNMAKIFDNPMMDNRWCVPVKVVIYYPHRFELTMAGLRSLFSKDWPWLRYPRGGTKIPAHILPPFLELIDSSLPRASAPSRSAA